MLEYAEGVREMRVTAKAVDVILEGRFHGILIKQSSNECSLLATCNASGDFILLTKRIKSGIINLCGLIICVSS